MSDKKINQELCFDSSKKLTLKIAHEALKSYAEKFPLAQDLNNKSIPIILDTNVLLSYYGMSQHDKNLLIEFLKPNKDRIFITCQVEKEFIKNRLNIIENNFFNPLKSIPNEFSSTYKSIKNTLKDFLNKKQKILSKDYPDIWEILQDKHKKINEILEDEDELGQKIAQAIEATTTDYKNIEVVDKLLEICSELKVTPALEQEEIKFIQEQYDTLWTKYDSANQKKKSKDSSEKSNENNNKRGENIFPGCGDKSRKEDPYGDFIIFHEILKFMVLGIDGSDNNSTDVIFLTRDITKRDWMHKDLSPIVHYIEKAYLTTGKTLFIIDAEKALEISFENIHKDNQSDLIIRESSIVNINQYEKWAFAYSREGNLYFNKSLMINPDEFESLERNDVVRYKIGKNPEGGDIAIEVEKVIYSFEDQSKTILKSTICNIDKYSGFGFVYAHPKNLYFHYTSLEKSTQFDDLDNGDELEYIVGYNEQGESVVRLARKALPTQSAT